MAIYRQVSMNFWTDSKVVDEFSPEDKYFYLYCFTNPHTNLCGCYEISPKQISNEMGYSVDSVLVLLDRFENVYNIIRYSKETKELLLLNWHKYNWTTSEKFRKPMLKEIDSIKENCFKVYLSMLANGDDSDTVSIPYPYGSDTTVTVTVSDTVSVNNTITKHSLSKTNSKLDVAFDEFWEAYPKKVGKKDARKAFDKAIKTVDLDTILQAIEVQKNSDQWSRDNGKYIPNPSTWLNQGRWDDELAPKGITVRNGRAVRDEAFWTRAAQGDIGL